MYMSEWATRIVSRRNWNDYPSRRAQKFLLNRTLNLAQTCKIDMQVNIPVSNIDAGFFPPKKNAAWLECVKPCRRFLFCTMLGFF